MYIPLFNRLCRYFPDARIGGRVPKKLTLLNHQVQETKLKFCRPWGTRNGKGFKLKYIIKFSNSKVKSSNE